MNVIRWIPLALLVLIAVAIVYACIRGHLPKVYEARFCMGRGWKARFPDVPKKEIRRFLQILVDAFLFKQKHRCKFSPDDKIYDIYRAVYTDPEARVDSMELEIFFANIEDEYGVEGLDKIWSAELTLGDTFEHARQAAAEALKKSKAAQEV